MKEKNFYYKITVKDHSPIDEFDDFMETQAGPFIEEMIKEYVTEKAMNIWDLEIVNVEEIDEDAKKV